MENLKIHLKKQLMKFLKDLT